MRVARNSEVVELPWVRGTLASAWPAGCTRNSTVAGAPPVSTCLPIQSPACCTCGGLSPGDEDGGDEEGVRGMCVRVLRGESEDVLVQWWVITW